MSPIAVVPGDGIGPEVVDEAIRTLDELALGLEFDVLREVCAGRFLTTGEILTDDELCRIRRSRSVLLGAIGDPRVRDGRYARGIVLRLRSELDLYVNYRPVRLLHDRLSPLRHAGRRGIDCVVVRENTEGLYAGMGGTLHAGTPDETAIDTDINTYRGVARIIDFALSNAERAVCMVDKSNAVPHGGTLWQRYWAQAAAKRPDLATCHMYADVAAMRLVTDPGQFEVVVTNNLFGDILSDVAAAVAGGLGAAPSANLNPDRGFGVYEPVHGSAPDLAGTGRANPLAAILSAALMLDRLGLGSAATAVRRAVTATVHAGRCTPDMGGSLNTRAVGDAVRAAL